MTRCDFYLKNNTPYDITLLSADGSDWGQWLGNVSLQANSGNFVKIEDMGCPSAFLQSDHWGKPILSLLLVFLYLEADTTSLDGTGWLMFKAAPAQFPNFAQYFYIYARQQDSGHCDDHYMATSSGATSHGEIKRIGTTSYT